LARYQKRNVKGYQGIVNYLDATKVSDKMSIYDYLNGTLNAYFEGNYGIKVNGKVKEGRKVKSLYNKVRIQNKILKDLNKELPEIFI